MSLRKRNDNATANRVLGTDGRFYNPMKHPEHHKKQVQELERRNKIHKLSEIEKEMELMSEEVKDLKFTLREEMRLNTALKEENARLLNRLDAIAVQPVKPLEAVVSESPIKEEVDPEKEAEKAAAIEEARRLMEMEVDASETDDVDPAIIKAAKEGGKNAVGAGELAKFEEHVVGNNAPKTSGNSADA